MGYYIEVPESRRKAAQLAEIHGAQIVPRPASFDDIPSDKALICVVDNRIFEAAGHCYSPAEFAAFAHDDGRPKQWLLMDRGKAEKLSGYAA